MTIDLTSYRSIGNLTDWLVRFSIIMIILYVIEKATEFYLILIGTIDNSQTFTVSDVFCTFIFIVSIPTIIIILFWFYRATKNINSFGAKYVNSPGMAVVWWFIPIMHLWKPNEVAQQIWRASNPEIKLTEGMEWRKVTSSNIIKIWWVLGLICVFGIIVVGNIGSGIISQYNIIDPEQAEQSRLMSLIVNLVTIPFLILAIISTIYFIRVVRQISTWQELKSGVSI